MGERRVEETRTVEVVVEPRMMTASHSQPGDHEMVASRAWMMEAAARSALLDGIAQVGADLVPGSMRLVWRCEARAVSYVMPEALVERLDLTHPLHQDAYEQARRDWLDRVARSAGDPIPMVLLASPGQE